MANKHLHSTIVVLYKFVTDQYIAGHVDYDTMVHICGSVDAGTIKKYAELVYQVNDEKENTDVDAFVHAIDVAMSSISDDAVHDKYICGMLSGFQHALEIYHTIEV